MKSDLEIARATPLHPIVELALAKDWGLESRELVPYGRHKAKVRLEVLERLGERPNGKYIVMTAVTPTPLGEGKTVTTIGAALGLNHIAARAIPCIRQPSMGPIFGIKGGAAGGGHAQVLPMEEVNLHLTGDMHAVSIAHNLGAAFLDNVFSRKNRLRLDPEAITYKRVVDLNDRALRDVVVGLGPKTNGVTRQSGFVISAASEVMAILALAENLPDLRMRIGRMLVGFNFDGEPVTVEDLKVAGAMTAVLREALLPNLLQTTEHTPAFIHCGPFANIAHGNSSIVADRIALKLADYVITEAGFGADMGAEKFFNIKCRASGLTPNAAGLVVTARALKYHAGGVTKRQLTDPNGPLAKEDLGRIRAGAANLQAQIANVHAHGVPVCVIVNRFATDTARELALVAELAADMGAERAVISDVHARGGPGGVELARALIAVCDGPAPGDGKGYRPLYELQAPTTVKIETLATTLYGAREVVFLPEAMRAVRRWNAIGADQLPVCMAKTQASLSHDPDKKGAPKDYRFVVRDVEASLGAGFLTPIAGDMNLMPGLPAHPGGEQIDIGPDGEIVGLF